MNIDNLEDRSPGEDPDDPYADIDISELPDWWQSAIREFRAYNLRPYRPPRFADGEISPPIIQEMEAQHDIDVKIVGKNLQHNSEVDVLVDGEPHLTVTRRRVPEGYTVYDISSDRFIATIEDTV